MHSDHYKALCNRLVFNELIGQGIQDEKVLNALVSVPRHEFVPEEYRQLAYENRALPLEHGQTISQPFIVAAMTQAAQVDKESKVLEIGTGSGYQAAVLAEICKEVYSVEVIESLADKATELLHGLGYNNVYIRSDNGYSGWKEQAPFDAIIVTAAAKEVPQPLLEQLKVAGRLVIPVGQEGGYQELLSITKEGENSYTTEHLFPVAFVPFV